MSIEKACDVCGKPAARGAILCGSCARSLDRLSDGSSAGLIRWAAARAWRAATNGARVKPSQEFR
jgi:hypothetical protein